MVLDLRDELPTGVEVTGATAGDVWGTVVEGTVSVAEATEFENEGEDDEDVVTGADDEGAGDVVGTGVVDALGAEDESVCSATENGREVDS